MIEAELGFGSLGRPEMTLLLLLLLEWLRWFFMRSGGVLPVPASSSRLLQLFDLTSLNFTPEKGKVDD